MANFIGLVYATLKNEGVDTKGMSTDEAVKKYNELQKTSGGKEGEKEATPAENRAIEKMDAKDQPKQQEKKEYERNSKGIKEELKDNGIDTKNIGVRERGGSYYITIKDPTIDKDKVEKIAEHNESYERDYATGEILSGGNTFVFVDYDYGVFDEVSKPYQPKAKEYLNKLKDIPTDNGLSVKDGVYIMKDGNSYDFVVHNDKQWTRRRFYTENELAKNLYQIDKFDKIM